MKSVPESAPLLYYNVESNNKLELITTNLRIMYKTFTKLLLAILILLPLESCKEDDDRGIPGFSDITVSPAKDVYEIGDVITCTIHMTKPAGPTLKKATYWWFTSWWFKDADQPVDFQEFSEDGTCVSKEITLTETGDLKLYFFGRLEYPKYDWEKIEIAKTIKVK